MASKKIMNSVPSQFFLNDSVINDYMNLIKNRYPDIYTFDTYFYFDLCKKEYDEMKKWTKKIDIFSKKKLIIPINLPKILHWVMICVDFDKNTIKYYDSLNGNKDGKTCLNRILSFLCDEHNNRKGVPLNAEQWTLIICKNIPLQRNLYDCGAFICTYAEYLARNATFNFTQTHMESFRQLMAYELTFKRLVDVDDRKKFKIAEYISNTTNSVNN